MRRRDRGAYARRQHRDRDILAPADGRLLFDGVRVLTRLLGEARQQLGADAVPFHDHCRVAKRRHLEALAQRGRVPQGADLPPPVAARATLTRRQRARPRYVGVLRTARHSGRTRSPTVHAHICTHYPPSPIIPPTYPPALTGAATLDRKVLATPEKRRTDA